MGVSSVDPIPAATVILMRDGSSPFEVLMVRRRDRGFFGGLVVFPGGAVEDIDSSNIARSVVLGIDPHHRFKSAALRELAEETGLAMTAEGVIKAPEEKGRDLLSALHASGAKLTGDALVLVSRWVTPVGAPKRFDTFFYLLEARESPTVTLDSTELVDHSWITPDDALHRCESGDWPMITPTLAHLRWLTRRASIADAFHSARGADGRTVIRPRVMPDGSLLPIHMPAEPS